MLKSEKGEKINCNYVFAFDFDMLYVKRVRFLEIGVSRTICGKKIIEELEIQKWSLPLRVPYTLSFINQYRWKIHTHEANQQQKNPLKNQKFKEIDSGKEKKSLKNIDLT